MAVNFNPRALDAFRNARFDRGHSITAINAPGGIEANCEFRRDFWLRFCFGDKEFRKPSAKPSAPGHERGERQGRFLERFHGVAGNPVKPMA